MQRYLVDASKARREAEEELLRTPPELPRNAKRMLNQLRVLLAVSLKRGMLSADTGLTASHLGRWVVLNGGGRSWGRRSSPRRTAADGWKRVTRPLNSTRRSMRLACRFRPLTDFFAFSTPTRDCPLSSTASCVTFRPQPVDQAPGGAHGLRTLLRPGRWWPAASTGRARP